MNLYTLGIALLSVAVFLAYINHRFIRMQTTIAIMTASLSISLILIVLQRLHITNINVANALIQRADFQHLLLDGMLGFLLFAGALTIDYESLKTQKWEIGTLASISTICSTVLVGLTAYYLLPLIGLSIPLVYCLLFGALISPTDPIAVLATFKKLNAPKKLSACVAGESLFNDGIGIVIFTTLAQLAFDHAEIKGSQVLFLFFKEAIGGLGYGLVLGIFTAWLIKPIHDSKVIILLSLAMVSAGYSFALHIGISGPLAMVVLGIFVGKKLRKEKSVEMFNQVETFWEVIDEVLNAVLFMLIGFELMVVPITAKEFVAILLMIPAVLLIRLVTVATPMKVLQFKHKQPSNTIAILTWGGLRGGLALALALSLPSAAEIDPIIAITYGIVTFSVIIQGLTIKSLATKAQG